MSESSNSHISVHETVENSSSVSAPWTADHRDAHLEALGRADSAAQAREQIMCYPNAVRMPANGNDLYVVRNFLTLDECAALIALIDAGRVPSPVVSDDPVPSYRTSETCYLYADQKPWRR